MNKLLKAVREVMNNLAIHTQAGQFKPSRDTEQKLATLQTAYVEASQACQSKGWNVVQNPGDPDRFDLFDDDKNLLGTFESAYAAMRCADAVNNVDTLVAACRHLQEHWGQNLTESMQRIAEALDEVGGAN